MALLTGVAETCLVHRDEHKHSLQVTTGSRFPCFPTIKKSINISDHPEQRNVSGACAAGAFGNSS